MWCSGCGGPWLPSDQLFFMFPWRRGGLFSVPDVIYVIPEQLEMERGSSADRLADDAPVMC